MVGGRNFHESQFNLATQGERQPGSAFKPFVLAAALRDGIAPSSTLVSHPVVIDAGGRAWSVENFEHNSMGPINLSTAIAYSDNTVFAQLTNIVGPANVADTAAEMGITTPLHPYFSIGLGGEPATPIEMARAYATLANGGYRLDSSIFRNEPIAVESVTFPSKDPSKPSEPTEQRDRPEGDPVARRTATPRSRTRCSRASSSTAPARRRSFRAGRSPGRPARPRTSATPGSSASRPTSSPPSGSATRTS